MNILKLILDMVKDDWDQLCDQIKEMDKAALDVSIGVSIESIKQGAKFRLW